MYKKSILSIAVASVLTLTGCLENNKIENKNDGAQTVPDPELPTEIDAITGQPRPDVGTYPIFDPGSAELPIPNDLIFDRTAGDGTFAVTPDPTNPAITALQSLSGASPIAPIDIKISGRIDATTLAGNVHLIKLDYASGDPVRGLSIQEPPTIPANPADWPVVSVEEKVLDGTSYIRINPVERLDPLTRYLVVITDGVLDQTGDPLVRHPGSAGYANLTDENEGLASGALASVKALINNLWEPIGVQYMQAIGNPTASADDIVLSYSFTTSDDEKVLEYIADPAQWFNDQLTRFLGVSAATEVVNGQLDLDSDLDVDYTDVTLAVGGALAAFPSADIQAALPTLFGAGAPCAGTTSTTAIGCIANVLTSVPSAMGGFADLLPTPTADTGISFDATSTLDINAISSLTAVLGITPGAVSVTQGTMTVPYYLSTAAGANGQPLVTDSWVADDVLAGAVNTAFSALGLSIPQADTSVSQVVNYVFPFPKKQADVEIPVLAVHSADLTNPDLIPVMYQHGIGTDRSTALAFGGSLVAGAKAATGADVAVIAIDQPLHGIDGISAAEQAALAEQLLNVAGTIDSTDGVDAGEQATIDAVVAGLFSAGVVQGVDAATNSGAPGATNCVDLATNGLAATTASILGGACDADPVVDAAIGQDASVAVFSAQVLERTVANGASTIPGLGTGADTERHFGFTLQSAGLVTDMDYTGSGSTNASGSMFINLTSFLTGRDNLRQQVTDLLTVRRSLDLVDLNDDGTPDLDDTNTYFIGHSLGTINGIPFVVAANGSATAEDNITATVLHTPGGGVVRLIENSVTRSAAIVGGLAGLGLTQDTASYQAFLNVFQATVDSGDAINFVDRFASTDLNTPALFVKVLNDQTIPNSVDSAGEVIGDGSISFLSGTDPLFAESGATEITSTGSLALTQNYVEFTDASSTHGTPAYPSTGALLEQAAFAEMVAQATSIILTGGAAVTVDNSNSVLDL